MKDWKVAIGACIWMLAISCGIAVLLSYDYTPGPAGSPPARWPAASQLRPLSGKANLVMMAHPHCPCTRASLGELEVLMAAAQGRLAAQVVFFRPRNQEADWEKSDLWDRASAIPNVTAVWDTDGQEAQRFHAVTSGHVVLYGAQGDLLFNGGITASRGHSGDNIGRAAITSALMNGVVTQSNAFVFGCSLLDASAQRNQ